MPRGRSREQVLIQVFPYLTHFQDAFYAAQEEEEGNGLPGPDFSVPTVPQVHGFNISLLSGTKDIDWKALCSKYDNKTG